MAEMNNLTSGLPVCLDPILAMDQETVDVSCDSHFLAAVPKIELKSSESSHAATEVFNSNLIADREGGSEFHSPLNSEALPGATRLRGRFGFDVHWLRETTPGKLDGLSGLRIAAEESFEAWLETGDDSVDKGAWVVLAPPSQEEASPLLMALMGIHPLEWVWSLWTEVGSPAWKSLTSEAQVRTSDLEEFPRIWMALGNAGRARLWQAARTTEELEAYTMRLRDEVAQWSIDAPPATRETLRILTSPNLRRLFLHVRAAGEKQFDGARIGRAMTQWDEYAKLHPWIRRRLGALLNSRGSELWPAVQRRTALMRTLELRIREMARGVLAARLIARDASDNLRSDLYLSLHLPFIDRRKLVKEEVDWTSPTLIAAGGNTILVGSAKEKPMFSITETEVAQTLATPFRMADVAGVPQEGELTFSYRRNAESGGMNPFWSMVLADYGFTAQTDDRDAVLTVTLPMEALHAWARIPPVRESAYIPPMSRMAQALQRTLRSWAPILHFDSPATLDNLRTEIPLIVYACMEPFSGRSRCHFTYDPADSADMQKALRSATKRLPGLLDALVAKAEGHGYTLGTSDALLRDSQQVLKWVGRHNRPTGALLSTEAFVIEEFIRLADMVRELKAMLLAPNVNIVKQLARFVEDFVTVLHRRLRRLHGTDCSMLAPLLLLQATAALHGVAPMATLTVERNGRATTYQSPLAA